ncbi:MAG: hypothetical protein KDA94_01015 [Acidimicrobiales bacterium]|nr:hypothetical protein [Acidimicrobiales bacterium]
MRRARHLLLLLRDLAEMSGSVGALWLLPVVVILLLTAMLAVTAQHTVPYVVYTFF